METSMVITMLAMIGAFTLVLIYLLVQRTRLARLSDEVQGLRNRLLGG